MKKYEFLGTVIYFDENEFVVILPGAEFTSTFSRRKLRDTDLRIGGEVFAVKNKDGCGLIYNFNKLKPGQEAILEQLRQRYLKHHKKGVIK